MATGAASIKPATAVRILEQLAPRMIPQCEPALRIIKIYWRLLTVIITTRMELTGGKGRKYWLFCWMELGAHDTGVIQSLLTTCRLQGVDPYVYLLDVLQRISTHPARGMSPNLHQGFGRTTSPAIRCGLTWIVSSPAIPVDSLLRSLTAYVDA